MTQPAGSPTAGHLSAPYQAGVGEQRVTPELALPLGCGYRVSIDSEQYSRSTLVAADGCVASRAIGCSWESDEQCGMQARSHAFVL